MSLSLDEVRHIAKLARLELAPGELEATQAKLNGIFSLIEEMQAVDTDGVEPMSHPQELASACASTRSPKPTAAPPSRPSRRRPRPGSIWCPRSSSKPQPRTPARAPWPAPRTASIVAHAHD